MAVSDQSIVGESIATGTQLDQLCINTIRTLSMDAVQKANSGHPGAPMALAPVAYCLWQQFLRYDPEDPTWPNRDRFVLSNGHASMLLYSLLHLAGVREVSADGKILSTPAVSLDEIKNFRQLGSKTPGHPEYGLTTGVETTTGPLGQGVANSVGMAIAERWLAQYFNRPGFELFNYNIWAICGDGDMMEGISSEAASIAGHLRLSNLCWIYDNNHITIEGNTDLAYDENVAARFAAYGWDVQHVLDANDLVALADAYSHALSVNDRPKLIIVDSHIGYGSPHRQDTKEAHGEPLGEEEVKLTKRFYGWPEDAKFLVPDGVRENFRDVMGKRGRQLSGQWNALFAKYSAQYPDLAAQYERMQRRQPADGWDKELPTFAPDAKGLATRDSSGKVLNAIAKNDPWLMGGSADLYPSTKTRLTFDGAGDFEAGQLQRAQLPLRHSRARDGRDRQRHDAVENPRLRLDLPHLQRLHEDADPPLGHHGSSLDLDLHPRFHRRRRRRTDSSAHRATDNAASGSRADDAASRRRQRSRRGVESNHEAAEGTGGAGPDAASCADLRSHEIRLRRRRGSRRLHPGRRRRWQAAGHPDGHRQRGLPLHRRLRKTESRRHPGARRQHAFVGFVRASGPELPRPVLPPDVTARVAVEMASTFGWAQYAGAKGRIIGMHTFGASAPLKDLQKKFGFTSDAVIQAARELLGK